MLLIILESSLLSVNPGLIVWTVITFLMLLFVLYKIAWKPILAAVANRERRIQESLDRSEQAQREADEKLASYQQLLENAKKETQEIVAKGQKATEAMREEILLKTKEDSARLLEKAKKEISLEREKALEEIRGLAVDLSLTAATKLMQRSMTDQDHRKIVERYLQELKVS